MLITNKVEYTEAYLRFVTQENTTDTPTFINNNLKKLRKFWINLATAFMLKQFGDAGDGRIVPEHYFVAIDCDLEPDGDVLVAAHREFTCGSGHVKTKPAFDRVIISKETLFDFLENHQS